MNRFNYDFRLQVYMYDFIFVDTETMSEEDYLPNRFVFVKTY